MKKLVIVLLSVAFVGCGYGDWQEGPDPIPVKDGGAKVDKGPKVDSGPCIPVEGDWMATTFVYKTTCLGTPESHKTTVKLITVDNVEFPTCKDMAYTIKGEIGDPARGDATNASCTSDKCFGMVYSHGNDPAGGRCYTEFGVIVKKL